MTLREKKYAKEPNPEACSLIYNTHEVCCLIYNTHIHSNSYLKEQDSKRKEPVFVFYCMAEKPRKLMHT